MANANPVPGRVEIDSGAALLRVGWRDGHASDYPLRYLRGFCPCAACQGHRAGPKTFVPTDAPLLEDVRMVGRYALSPIWHDGHNTGIYSFGYLRGLCPCADCRPGGIPADQR